MTSIGKNAFKDSGTKNPIKLPRSLEVIPEGAFANSKTPRVDIPESVTTIGKQAFMESALTEVDLPRTVTSVEQQAFYRSDSLAQVRLTDETELGSGVFISCASLEHVDGTANNVGSGVFSGCTALLGADVKWATSNTFNGCTSLTSVSICNDQIDEIGASCFANCTSLEQIAMPKVATSIGSSAFRGCGALEQVDFKDGLKTIDGGAFTDCVALGYIELPDSVTSIGSSAFMCCTALGYVKLPEGITSISTATFKGCTALKEVVIPDSVTKIGANAFDDCTSLEAVYIPPTVTTIGSMGESYGSFLNCSNLTIYGADKSAAQSYANNRGIPFVVADTIPGRESTGGDTVLTSDDGSILMGSGMLLKYEVVFGEPVYGRDSAFVQTSDEDVACATSTGIRALGQGTATLTAKLVSSGEWVSRTVRVLGGFTQTTLEMIKGESATLSWDAIEGYTPGVVYLSHDGPSVTDFITVTPTGTVTANMTSGRMSNAVRMDLAPGLYTECLVYVLCEPAAVAVDPESMILNYWKAPVWLKVSVGRSEAERGYTFTSSNSDVVSIYDSSIGRLQPKLPGRATITVEAYNGVKGTCEVTVLPKDVTMETVESYLAGIDSVYQSLTNMNLFFTAEGYDYVSHAGGDEHEVHMQGVDLAGLSNDGVQAAFSMLSEGVVEGGADVIFRKTSNAYYLADLIMVANARTKESKFFPLSEAKKLIGSTKELSGVADGLNYLLELLTDEDGKLRLTGVDWKKFDEDYKKTGLFNDDTPQGQALKGMSYAGDVVGLTKALLTVFDKYSVYKSVNPADLEPYIISLSQCDTGVSGAGQSGNDYEALKGTAALLEGFRSDDCFMMLMGFYGFPAFAKTAAKYLKKALKLGEAVSAIPIVGPFLKGAEIGRAIGNGLTHLILNIDDVQQAMIRSSYAARTANSYRPRFEKLYEDFRSDPLNIVKFQQFSAGCKGFGELIAAEYEAYAAMPKAVDKALVKRIENLFTGTSYEDFVDSLEDCADLARNIAYPQLTLYSRDILKLN